MLLVVVVVSVVVVEVVVVLVVSVVDVDVLVVVETVVLVDSVVVVLVVVSLDVVLVEVVAGAVVVVVVAHPESVQASQQLATTPTQASPPARLIQRAASRFTLQLASPLAFVRQQVTAPRFPHVDRAAHRTTAPLQ